jgi:hypothetical protein
VPMTTTHEIVHTGADAEQGPSLLRWTDGNEWYVAVINADGSLLCSTRPSQQKRECNERNRSKAQ